MFYTKEVHICIHTSIKVTKQRQIYKLFKLSEYLMIFSVGQIEVVVTLI